MTATPTNGFDQSRMTQVISEIEQLHLDIASLNKSNSEKVARVRQAIGEKYKEAKLAWGIPTRALKHTVKKHRTIQKLEQELREMEEEDQESVEQIESSLGDLAGLPLGQALLAKVKPSVDSEQTADRSTAQTEREADRKERKARKNAALDAVAGGAAPVSNGAEQLATGLKPLHS